MFGSFVAGGGDPGESWPVVRARVVRSVEKMTIVSFDRWDWDKRGVGRWGDPPSLKLPPPLKLRRTSRKTRGRGRGAVGGRMKSAGRGQTCRVNHPGWKRLACPPVAGLSAWGVCPRRRDSTREGPGPGRKTSNHRTDPFMTPLINQSDPPQEEPEPQMGEPFINNRSSL